MVCCCLVKSCCCGCSDVESGAKYIAVAGIVASIVSLASAFYPLNILQVQVFHYLSLLTVMSRHNS